MATERVLSNLNLISFKTEGGLQNHIDELQDGDLVFTPDNSLKGTLLDFKWADHLLNDISWLRGDTFSWHDGEMYKAAYNHLVADFEGAELKRYYAWVSDSGHIYYSDIENVTNGRVAYMYNNGKFTFDPYIYFNISDGAVSVGTVNVTRDASKDKDSIVNSNDDTFGDTTITYYRAEDGHKICLPDQEDKLLELYNKTGVAWYYILDTENKQFKLPRTKWGFTGLRDTVGNYVKPGIPNLSGYVGSPAYSALGSTDGTLFYETSVRASVAAIGSHSAGQVGFDASRVSSVYNDSATVQPPATQMYLYFYVGNFEQDAVEQTAGITVETLNEKADVDLSNMNASQAAKDTITGWAVPDYSAGIAISANTDFICPMHGVIAGEVSAATGGYCQIKVNGIVIMSVGSENNQRCRGPFYAQIQKGDIVHILTSGNANIPQSNFYPLKGVN